MTINCQLEWAWLNDQALDASWSWMKRDKQKLRLLSRSLSHRLTTKIQLHFQVKRNTAAMFVSPLTDRILT